MQLGRLVRVRLCRTEHATRRSLAGVRAFSSLPSDPHRVLGVPRGASTTEIRAAYLKRAKTLHPDTNPATDAHKDFLRVKQAYEALCTGAGDSRTADAARPAGGERAHQWPGNGSPYGPHRPYGSQHSRSNPYWDQEYSNATRRARPSPTFWHLVRSGRAFGRGGAIHRAGYSFVYSVVAMWPVWLILGTFFMMSRGRRHRPVVYYDENGRAFSADRFGTLHRFPEYDDIRN